MLWNVVGASAVQGRTLSWLRKVLDRVQGEQGAADPVLSCQLEQRTSPRIPVTHSDGVTPGTSVDYILSPAHGGTAPVEARVVSEGARPGPVRGVGAAAGGHGTPSGVAPVHLAAAGLRAVLPGAGTTTALSAALPPVLSALEAPGTLDSRTHAHAWAERAAGKLQRRVPEIRSCCRRVTSRAAAYEAAGCGPKSWPRHLLAGGRAAGGGGGGGFGGGADPQEGVRLPAAIVAAAPVGAAFLLVLRLPEGIRAPQRPPAPRQVSSWGTGAEP